MSFLGGEFGEDSGKSSFKPAEDPVAGLTNTAFAGAEVSGKVAAGPFTLEWSFIVIFSIFLGRERPNPRRGI